MTPEELLDEQHALSVQLCDLARRGNVGFVLMLCNGQGKIVVTSNMTPEQRLEIVGEWLKGHCRYCALTAARARGLVRRLRAGIAECERVIEPLRNLEHRAEPAHVAFHVATDILAKLTGATGEEQSR